MKFSQYVQLREADETQEIDAIFNQAATDIKDLFTQLYRGTADMVNNYEKASLPDELKHQIISDLGKIAQKIKGNVNKVTKTESVAINSLVNLAEASIIDDIG